MMSLKTLQWLEGLTQRSLRHKKLPQKHTQTASLALSAMAPMMSTPCPQKPLPLTMSKNRPITELDGVCGGHMEAVIWGKAVRFCTQVSHCLDARD